MAYILRLYYGNRIRNVDLLGNEKITIGGSESDTVCIHGIGLSKKQIVIAPKALNFIIKGKGIVELQEGSPRFGKTVKRGDLKLSKRYYISTEPALYISLHPRQADKEDALNISGIDELTIGRSKRNNIVLLNRKTSGEHCRIYREESGLLKIEDCDSTNGTYLNEKQITEAPLQDGDIIYCSIYWIKYESEKLYFYNVGEDMTIRLTPFEDSESIERNSRRGGTKGPSNINIRIKHESKSNGTLSAFDINIQQKSKQD